jgi:hypothetical protein
MKSVDVLVGKQNGHFLAWAKDYPSIAESGSTVDEAVSKAKSAVEDFLMSLQVVRVTLNVPEGSGYSTAQDWLEAAQLYQQENDETYQQYQAQLAAEKQRQLEASELEAASTKTNL